MRNGQTYGPYTLEDLQRYVASGNVLLSDMAKSEDMQEWVPVSQLLSPAGAPPMTEAAYPVPPAAAAAYNAGSSSAYPDPPNLHWALVLLLGFLTCGIFTVVYDLVQAAWLRRIVPSSKALIYYIVASVFWLANTANSVSNVQIARTGHSTHGVSVLGGLASIGFFVFLIAARFSMRQSLEEHYNGPEPIGLRLGPIMTFFFGGLYFQFHFNRINEIRHGLVYR
jgi:hypothetical protein